MKFDFVIGNPPYQQETSEEITTNGQKSRKNIFHHFQIAADDISRVGSVMIYPGGRWIHQSGKGLKQFGYEQINDTRLARVYFYPDSKEIFGSAADLADGVSIVIKRTDKKEGGFEYIWSKGDVVRRLETENPGEDLLPLDPNDVAITSKIVEFVQKYHLGFLHDAILPRSLFGIESDFVSKNPGKVKPYSDKMKIDPKSEIKLFTNDKAGKSGRAMWFVANRNVIESNQELIDEWQVVVSSANAGGQKRDSQLEIIDNHSAFGRARVALRSFKTLEEARNFYSYVRTYLVRYAFLMTDEALTTLGKRVPDLINYSSDNALIDFSKNLDSQLFELVGFDEAEKQYVCEVVDNVRKRG